MIKYNKIEINLHPRLKGMLKVKIIFENGRQEAFTIEIDGNCFPEKYWDTNIEEDILKVLNRNERENLIGLLKITYLTIKK